MSAAARALGMLTGVGIAGAAGLWLATRPLSAQAPAEDRTMDGTVTTVEDAVRVSHQTGLTGWALVDFAQHLVARKFTHSRLNPWDSPERAFQRGLGYCQQQALALQQVMERLGIASRPVFATRCAFPAQVVDGLLEPPRVSGHVWLRVTVDGEERDVCPGNDENSPGVTHFRVESAVRTLHPLLRPFTHVASVAENVRRHRQQQTTASQVERMFAEFGLNFDEAERNG